MIDGLLQRVEAAIYLPIAPLSITGWITREPVRFEHRRSGRQIELLMGEPWAAAVFDCAWMRFQAFLPDTRPAGTLVVRIDVNGEVCLVDREGVPVRGLTCVKSTFEPKLGGPGKTVYRVPPEAMTEGWLELWGDAALNDLFGNLRGGGVLALAEVAVCREDVRQLYYDLETLRDYHRGLASGSPHAAQLEDDFRQVEAGLSCDQPQTVEAARARLRPWFHSADKPALRVSAIGHAHLDLAWLWPIRETIRKGARTFATACYNLELYPEYLYGCSQPQLFAWMKRDYPALYAKIRAAVAAGRIEPLGSFWVEPDCNLPGGESFVRQILHGRRFFREEFGLEPRLCWQPDVFGYHGQLPQILRRSGHEWFMTQKLSWNVVNRFPYHSFLWEGIDGTSIPVHMLVEETYNGPAAARSLKKIADEYAEKSVSDQALMVYGIGDGGGGPDAEHLERLRRAGGLPGLPAAVNRPAEAFFAEWSKAASRFPRWQGELYLERHQGTLTTQARVKRFNRFAEVALREAEWAACLAAWHTGAEYPGPALDRLWQEILLYQFHDILPGSSIKRVYDECHERYAAILGELNELQAAGYSAVAARFGSERGIIFNSLAWSRKEWIKTGEGWHDCAIPALGAVEMPDVAADLPPIRAETTALENDLLRVEFGADGRIGSIFDKAARRELIPPGEWANSFEVRVDLGDAWDFEADLERKDVWKYLERPVERPTLERSVARVDGPQAILEQVWRWKNCRIVQQISLAAGSPLLSFATEVDWQEPGTMLRVCFPVAVTSDEARFEIPFGHLRRSTREDTSQQRAQFEVAALQWVDLSETTHGIALLNDCKHGFRVKGHVLDMAVLRSVPHPHDGSMATNSQTTGLPASTYTDLAVHSFRYALWPHADAGDAAELTRRAREFNTPLRVVGAVRQTGDRLRRIAPIQIEQPAIELVAAKPAEAGPGWVFRFVNVTAQAVETAIEFTPADSRVFEVDLLEQPVASRSALPPSPRHRFGPFEIKTLLWKAPLC